MASRETHAAGLFFYAANFCKNFCICDRMYINATDLGLVCEYYKTGNIHYAEFQGEHVSNSNARAMQYAKTYIDVKTGKLYSDHEYLRSAAQELIEQAAA